MDKKKILNKLSDATAKLDIIKANIEHLGLRAALENAAVLRENVCKDHEITEGCNSDAGISSERKRILDLIRAFQIELITETIGRNTGCETSYSTVADFKKAKAEMSEMIDAEISDNLFADDGQNSIFEKMEGCAGHMASLHRVKRNCDDDKYIILLMGEFQAGKSTTLDALCDGHHISAIGDGTATSAVLISVSYAPEESINIRWKNKEQLTQILYRLKIFFPGFDWESFDLDVSKSREELSLLIENLRQSGNCPKIGKADSKFIMISHFLLKYYSSAELEQKKDALRNVTEIPNVTRFPKKGEVKWQKSGLETFGIEEALFVFIDSVECYTPSETLRRLNCIVIDSPGLFNSTYDTMITQQAMIDAHAILYLLPRHKGIGEDNCGSLYYIKDNYSEVHSKLFIVNNLDFTLDCGFFTSNCETVKAMFGEEKEVYPYDARLSYLTQLKKSYCSGGLKEGDYSHLMSASRMSVRGARTKVFTDFNEAWTHHIGKYRSCDDVDISGTPEELLCQAGFSDMISALEAFVTKNKAYAMIVSNGIDVMSSELTSIVGSLYRQYVETYVSSFEEMEGRWRDRISKAEKFQSDMSGFVWDALFTGKKSSLLERITDEEYRKLFTGDYFQELAEAIAGVLYDNKSSLLLTKTLFNTDKELFKQRFLARATPWIEKEILNLLSTKILYMCTTIDRNQDSTITNIFKPAIESVEVRLANRWAEEFEGESGFKMSDYVSIPKNLSGVLSESVDCDQYNTGSMASGMLDLTLIGGLVAQIAATVTGIASMVAGYITAIFCDPTGASLAGALLLGVGGTIIVAFAPDYVRSKFIRPLAKQIRPKLESEGGVGFRSIIRRQLYETFSLYAHGIRVDIQKMKNERDIALAPQADQEALCIRAAEAIAKINKQLDIYDDYKKENLN